MPGTEILNYREFEAGPDPFGRKFQVLLKWLQTAISIRHSDTVDVKYILTAENGETAISHGRLLGDILSFSVGAVDYEGRVNGDTLEGTLRRAEGTEEFRAVRDQGSNQRSGTKERDR